jgi:hypothetical protein
MSNEKFTLEIISHHPQFAKKSLRKYYVDGIETVGAWGDEPFEIRFKNNTYQKVQVKLSLDGTDILTGKLADTELSNKMWVVNAYDTLSLKAWPEDNNGGAGFVFTGADNSVAGHTHGNLSSRGIIAAAVFTEGHVEPQRLNYDSYTYNTTKSFDGRRSRSAYYQGGNDITKGTTIGSTKSSDSVSYNSSAPMDHLNLDLERSVELDDDNFQEISEQPTSAKLKSLVAIGAGQHVDQKIIYATGLIKPMFSETVRVKYLWWDDLVAKLRTQTTAQDQPSGFPGDGERKNIDLKDVPKIGDKKATFRRSEISNTPVFERV